MITVKIFKDYCTSIHKSPDNSILYAKDLQLSKTIDAFSLSTTRSVPSDTRKTSQQAGNF